jgi:uncharacterized membrane protein
VDVAAAETAGAPEAGLRTLVDVAERSIAQPFNDSTTTLQALHPLRDLAARPLPGRPA